jgi:hypothetical protein
MNDTKPLVPKRSSYSAVGTFVVSFFVNGVLGARLPIGSRALRTQPRW